MGKKINVETLGEPGNYVKVKKMMSRIGPIWIAGLKITSDDGKMTLKMPCGKGGVIEATRQRAILTVIHEHLQHLPGGFDKARGILNKIFEQVTNNPDAK
jgi:hypothetical protein